MAFMLEGEDGRWKMEDGGRGKVRSAASPIGANLAEGFKRRSWKDNARFYTMAEESLAEVENFLYLSGDLGYLKDPKPLFGDTDHLAGLL